MNKLTIIGASGHGKVVADIAKLTGYTDIEFLDDDENLKTCMGYPVVGHSEAIPTNGDVFVAIGNSMIRKRITEQCGNIKKPILIHPKAIVADNVEIGEGTVIMAGAVINSGAKIGCGVIVNTSSSIDHDCMIGDYAHISVGAHLAGSVVIGEGTWIGIGGIVSNNVSICCNSLIGAGAVVIANIDEPGTYIGIPARRKK